MKTILIPISHGHQARNVLQTECMDVLQNLEDTKLIFFVPPLKLEFYRKHYSGIRNAEFVPFKYSPQLRLYEKGLEFVATNLLNTHSKLLLQHTVLNRSKRLSRFPLYALARGVSLTLGNYSPLRRTFRALDARVVSERELDNLFRKYYPDLVFASDVLNPVDQAFLRAAADRKIKNVAMVRSWDNLTSKGVVRITPDKLIVHTKEMKEEAMRIADVPEKNIVVVGVPAFDAYYHCTPSPKQEFYKRIGADLEKRIILFAPYFDFYSDTNFEVIDALDQAINDGRIPNDFQILVRFPPSWKFKNGEREQKKERKNVLYDIPGKPFPLEGKNNDWEFLKDDTQHLIDTLHYSSVSINYASTLAIESAFFDRPVINIAFDPKNEKKVPLKSIRRIYTTEHYSPVVETGGVSLAYSHEHLIELISEYSSNPEMNKGGRRRIADVMCGVLDGAAGKRVGEVLRDML